MKTRMTSLLIFLLLVFMVTQCTKNPTESEPVMELLDDESFTEIIALANEIEQLDELGLTDDSPDGMPNRLRMALVKLDEMLNRVRVVVMASEIDDAIMLYQEARAAQQRAIHTSHEGDYRRAFGFIRESHFLAQEAVRIVKGEMTSEEIKGAVLQRLVEKKEGVQGLLDEVSALLEGHEYDYAQRLYERAVLHLELAEEALSANELRRGYFHLTKAEEFAQRALRILNQIE
ncbi:hypothetical protein JW824_05395 [bacterium]|nr:hypothetical protein [bacterium]RQV96311.1 MAG: hypothetical protein EH221_04900 [bacterium]